jgi:hypothetical protein
MRVVNVVVKPDQLTRVNGFVPGASTVQLHRATHVSQDGDDAKGASGSVCLIARVAGSETTSRQWVVARFPLASKGAHSVPIDVRLSMETIELRTMVVSGTSSTAKPEVVVNGIVSRLEHVADVEDEV